MNTKDVSPSQQLPPAKPNCLADLDPWGGSKPRGWSGSTPHCLHVWIFMALLTPDHLIILNFVFITFLKYHLRNLSFLGYSQCLFVGQRRPAVCVAMPHHLFSCCVTGVSITAVAVSFHRADGFLRLCLVCSLTVQPEQGANTLLSNLTISFQQQQLNVTPSGPEWAESLLSPCNSPITMRAEDSKRETLLVLMAVLWGILPSLLVSSH